MIKRSCLPLTIGSRFLDGMVFCMSPAVKYTYIKLYRRLLLIFFLQNLEADGNQ